MTSESRDRRRQCPRTPVDPGDLQGCIARCRPHLAPLVVSPDPLHFPGAATTVIEAKFSPLFLAGSEKHVLHFELPAL